MDIILLQRIEKLGSIGDVVTVKDGYARNFLLPQKRHCAPTKPTRRSSKRTAIAWKRKTRNVVPKPKRLAKRSMALKSY